MGPLNGHRNWFIDHDGPSTGRLHVAPLHGGLRGDGRDETPRDGNGRLGMRKEEGMAKGYKDGS